VNINPANICPGSGRGMFLARHATGGGRTTCPNCGRSRIRVRVTGALYKHSVKGK
jgi:ribosomal protein S27AE